MMSLDYSRYANHIISITIIILRKLACVVPNRGGSQSQLAQ